MRIFKGVIIIFVAAIVVFMLTRYIDRSSSRNPTQSVQEDGKAKQEIRSQITTFGEKLKNVSLLSPTASSDIEREYGPFLSRSLLSSWMSRPGIALGRQTSSPWPDHIDVVEIEKNTDGNFSARAVLVLMTSEEALKGGDAGTSTLEFTLIKEAGEWKIDSYTLVRERAPNTPREEGDIPKLE